MHSWCYRVLFTSLRRSKSIKCKSIVFDWIFNSFEKSFKLLELFSVRLGSLICFQWCKWSSGFFNSDHPHSSLLSQASLNCLFRFLWFYIFNCVDAGPASFHWSLRHQNRIGEYGLKYWDKQFIVWLDNEFVIRTNCTNDADDLCFLAWLFFSKTLAFSEVLGMLENSQNLAQTLSMVVKFWQNPETGVGLRAW